MQLRNRLDIQLRPLDPLNPPCTPGTPEISYTSPGPSLDRLDSLDSLDALDLSMKQQSQRQRSVCTSLLRALMLWTSSIHRKPQNPRTAYALDPVTLLSTDERSDAAVVGFGNKAMGKSSLLTF